jgi:hypothetical protein
MKSRQYTNGSGGNLFWFFVVGLIRIRIPFWSFPRLDLMQTVHNCNATNCVNIFQETLKMQAIPLKLLMPEETR